MKLLKRFDGKKQSGFTLVELIVTIVLIGMVMGLAGIFFNFSFLSEKKVEEEFMLQADMRRTSEMLNNEIRNATVTFTLTEEVFTDEKKDNYNYFGVEDGTKIVKYNWNPTTKDHEKKVLLTAPEGITYDLIFKKNDPESKLIEFRLLCIPEDNEHKKIEVKTELNALNSVAVDDAGSDDDPAIAIAYSTEPTPTPKEQTTQTNVTIAVALVLDESGSMAKNMDGTNAWYSSTNVRMTILKNQANNLIDQFAAKSTSGGIQVCIIPFSENANNPGLMYDCYQRKADLKTKISSLSADGGTNTGDGLRRAYYRLKEYNDAYPGKEIVNYVIILTDGNPTYRSVTSSGQLLTVNGNATYRAGSGTEETTNINNCMNYVRTISEGYIVGDGLDIKTFVIGFSAIATDIDRAELIAGYCTIPSNPKRQGTYYVAGSSIELEEVFNTITETMLSETWHIYGPY